MHVATVVIQSLLFLSLIPSAHAMTDQERELIRRLHDELVTVTTLIDAAEQAADTQGRRQFHYPALKADLQTIRQGLSDALNMPRREPRALPPLNGEYR